ncbi:MAG TPA: 50S ribosomal protein L25/general stress protein Ctc [Steroidobacteraceae bacterium]|nr:50S ribosomal protein L25/general stress protein Ctc [Steroidobacteraceae bacterium]
MSKAIVVGAESRKDQGKGASRRLRHAGKVPAILYGGKGEPSNIAMDQLKLLNVIGDERFYSSLVTLQLDGKDQQVIIKDVQMHPARNAVLHVDLQRVLADQAIRIHLPIHFINETTCPGVKTEGGQVSHLKTDVEISCLPKDLPEALVVDMGAMHLNDTIFLKDIKVPAGVTIPELATGRDIPVVSIHAPRAEEPEPVAAEAAAAAATPAAGDAKAPAAGDAKAAPAAEAKKEGGKK